MSDSKSVWWKVSIRAWNYNTCAALAMMETLRDMGCQLRSRSCAPAHTRLVGAALYCHKVPRSRGRGDLSSELRRVGARAKYHSVPRAGAAARCRPVSRSRNRGGSAPGRSALLGVAAIQRRGVRHPGPSTQRRSHSDPAQRLVPRTSLTGAVRRDYTLAPSAFVDVSKKRPSP